MHIPLEGLQGFYYGFTSYSHVDISLDDFCQLCYGSVNTDELHAVLTYFKTDSELSYFNTCL